MIGLYRGIAQLVEQRSPKPRVQSSSLCAPATGKALKPNGFKAFSLCFRGRRTVCFAAFWCAKNGVNFPSGCIRLQRFRLLHHQKSIKISSSDSALSELSLCSATQFSAAIQKESMFFCSFRAVLNSDHNFKLHAITASKGFLFLHHPSTTSNIIITLKPAAKSTVPILECLPCDISGINSSTTT